MRLLERLRIKSWDSCFRQRWIMTGMTELENMQIPRDILSGQQQIASLFVSRHCGLGCRSRRFDCLLLLFFRRWGRLITGHYLCHKGCLRLVHFDPLFHAFSVPPLYRLLLCFMNLGTHAPGISIPLSPLLLLRWSPIWRSFLEAMSVPVRISINKLDFVRNRLATSRACPETAEVWAQVSRISLSCSLILSSTGLPTLCPRCRLCHTRRESCRLCHLV